MSPTGYEHGNIEAKLAAKLYSFVSTHKLGRVQSGEVGIFTHRNPDTVRGVDLLFITNERYAKRKSPSYLDIAPDLVVEIMSPDDRWMEVTEKLREYFAIGVRLVWIIAPKTRSVYAYRTVTDVREFTEKDDLPGDEILPGFSIKVEELFEA